MPEYSGTWKEIWTQKGQMKGTVDDIVVYDGWEKSTTTLEETAHRIIDVLDIKQTDKVLEVGCGAGGLAQYMDCNYIGIDFSLPLTKRCMEFFNRPAIYAEANSIPFIDGCFDKCFCWGVFLYFPSVEYGEECLNEMMRVTGRGKNRIFIGDIPLVSHNDRHQVYTKDLFEKKGFITMRGWAEPYQDDRFNVLM